jgi:hypothetical protein
MDAGGESGPLGTGVNLGPVTHLSRKKSSTASTRAPIEAQTLTGAGAGADTGPTLADG